MSETPSSHENLNRDLVDFGHLIAQESHSVQGQFAKMNLIEQLIRNRFDQQMRHAAEYSRSPRSTFPEEPERSVQQIRISRMQLGDGRFNLIVEKGDGDPDNEDPNIYRVMIPAHVDTVKAGAPIEMIHDPADTDRISGQGVYDMLGAVLNNIALAIETKIPQGMKAYFVFTVDEENNSVGAQELINQWDVFPLINAIVSSEIGPLPPQKNDDKAVRMITARAGRIKFIGSMDIDHRKQGHGSEADMPNASQAVRHFLNALEARFYQGYRDPETQEQEPPQQQKHPLLGLEQLEDGDMRGWKTREGYFPPDRGEYDFAIRMVPPSTRQDYEAYLKRWAKGIAKKGKWNTFGISNQFGVNPNKASYSPYEIPATHPVVKTAENVILRVTGLLPHLVGAPSVADECDYAEAGKPVITIPINGDEAHHPDEWVSWQSIQSVRSLIRELLEASDGFPSFIQRKNE